MKKLLYILLLVVAIIGCQTERDKQESSPKQYVFHTFYGDINLDTMRVSMISKGDPCYIVSIVGAKHDTLIYYNPNKDSYLKQFPTHDEHGNCVIDFNPYEK